MDIQEPKDTLYCSFCHKGADVVSHLVAGPAGVNICKDCVGMCNEIIANEKIKEVVDSGILLSPMELKAKLDDYVIGQEQAKKLLSVAVHNHYKRVFFSEAIGNEIELHGADCAGLFCRECGPFKGPHGRNGAKKSENRPHALPESPFFLFVPRLWRVRPRRTPWPALMSKPR